MISFNCMHMEWLRDDQPTIFAGTSSVLNEFDLQSLINYGIALKKVFQGSAHWAAVISTVVSC